LILSGRVGKHTDRLAQELIWNTEGKTEVSLWFTDGWKAYERKLDEDVIPHFKDAALLKLKRQPCTPGTAQD
jgi:insertion element IS1 protein InsB